MSYIKRLMGFNSKYWYLYLIGIVGSLFIGAIFPTYAYLLSNIIVTLSGVKYATDEEELAQYQEEVICRSKCLGLEANKCRYWNKETLIKWLKKNLIIDLIDRR